MSERRTREQAWSWVVDQTEAGQPAPTTAEIAAWAGVARSTAGGWLRFWRAKGEDPTVKSGGGGGVQAPEEQGGLGRTEPGGSGRFPGLTPEQIRAVIWKAAGKKNAWIARKLGLRRQTVSEWMGLDTMRAAVEDVAQENHDAALRELKKLAQKAIRVQGKALDRLDEILSDPRWHYEDDDTDADDTDEGRKKKGKKGRKGKKKGRGGFSPKIIIGAARTIKETSRVLWDHGGYPKTERQEIVKRDENPRPYAGLSNEELDARLAELDAELAQDVEVDDLIDGPGPDTDTDADADGAEE